MPDTITYRHVNENQGGTIICNDHTISYVGTDRCVTCVGIYIPIDDKKCFCAHINAYVRDANHEALYTTTNEEGEELKAAVLNKLQMEAHKSNWEAQHIAVSNSHRVIIVCPHLNGLNQDIAKPAYWVIEAVKEFLAYMNHNLFHVDRNSQGSVVDHKGEGKHFFPKPGVGGGVHDYPSGGAVRDWPSDRPQFMKQAEQFDSGEVRWWFAIGKKDQHPGHKKTYADAAWGANRRNGI